MDKEKVGNIVLAVGGIMGVIAGVVVALIYPKVGLAALGLSFLVTGAVLEGVEGGIVGAGVALVTFFLLKDTSPSGTIAVAIKVVDVIESAIIGGVIGMIPGVVILSHEPLGIGASDVSEVAG